MLLYFHHFLVASWSYVFTETLTIAMATLFSESQLKESSIEVIKHSPSNTGESTTTSNTKNHSEKYKKNGTKLSLEMRLLGNEFSDREEILNAGRKIEGRYLISIMISLHSIYTVDKFKISRMNL